MSAQVRLGVEGGFNLSKFVPTDRSSKPTDDSYNTGWFRGGLIGLVAEAPLSHKLFLKSGFRINGKGSILKTQTSIDTSQRNIEVHYAEVPIILVYKRRVGNNNFVSGGLGLYVAKAVRGVEEGEGRYISGTYYIHREVEFADENPYQTFPLVMKPIDWGYVARVGFEYKRFQLDLSFEISNQPVLPNSKLYGLNFKNAEVGFSATYFIFNLKK